MAKRSPTRAVVIGGGVIGVTTAAALVQRGLEVTLIERAEALATGVSARNGAQLSYSSTDALATPSMWRELPSLVTGQNPALRIRPTLHASLISWGFKFLLNCTSTRFRNNTQAVLRLALCSRTALAKLLARYPELEFEHCASGKIHIYDTVDKFESAKQILPLKNAFGCGQRALEPEELYSLEPALSGASTIVGAVHSPIDEAGDSCLFTRALAARAAQDGLTVLTRTAVQGFIVAKRQIVAIKTRAGDLEADVCVLAAGPQTPALARKVGIHVPILPMKGYSITLPATSRSPEISITDVGAKIVFCRLRDRVRIAGVAELGHAGLEIDQRKVLDLLRAARRRLPLAADWAADPQPWSGARPMTPDSRPIISGTPVENLILNCGHGMLGWTLACGSAELAASLIAREPVSPRIPQAEFRLDRF